ncbi:MAG: hypothetical protein LBF22_14005 [Deltaproteobacteria bacterium]|jgi:hypothetical protein|nr:hypothetical protein [Deltaproteobacteria bacterium]
MQKIFSNWKSYPFFFGLVLLFIFVLIVMFSGGESSAESGACNNFFEGAPLTSLSDDRGYSTSSEIIYYMSPDKQTIVTKWESVEHNNVGQPYYHPRYTLYSCSGLRKVFKMVQIKN